MAGFLRSVSCCSCSAPPRQRSLHPERSRPPIPWSSCRHWATRSFAIGCALSFCLGVGLFGSVYLMPVFLAYVRHHDAFEIGTIMLVTGVSQLVTAPIAGMLESRFDPRWLSAAGFGLFALGLACSAFQSRVADFDEMFWPQVLARRRHHVLPAAADAAGARRIDRRTGARRKRPVQPDAKPRRCDRHRIDRYHPLWPHRRTRRSAARPADRGRRHGGAGDRA